MPHGGRPDARHNKSFFVMCYVMKFLSLRKYWQMSIIQAKKLELLEWLATLQDKALIQGWRIGKKITSVLLWSNTTRNWKRLMPKLIRRIFDPWRSGKKNPYMARSVVWNTRPSKDLLKALKKSKYSLHFKRWIGRKRYTAGIGRCEITEKYPPDKERDCLTTVLLPWWMGFL